MMSGMNYIISAETDRRRRRELLLPGHCRRHQMGRMFSGIG
jgi:hypothetical protein